MLHEQTKFHPKALQHMLDCGKSLVKLKKILSQPSTKDKSLKVISMKTEKSKITNNDKLFRNTSQFTEKQQPQDYRIQLLDNKIKYHLRKNKQFHQENLSQLLKSQQEVQTIQLFHDNESPYKVLGRVQPEQKKNNRGMKELIIKIKTKMAERDLEFYKQNSEKINQIQYKISNMQASRIFKQFIIQRGHRQPDFLKDVEIK